MSRYLFASVEVERQMLRTCDVDLPARDEFRAAWLELQAATLADPRRRGDLPKQAKRLRRLLTV